MAGLGLTGFIAASGQDLSYIFIPRTSGENQESKYITSGGKDLSGIFQPIALGTGTTASATNLYYKETNTDLLKDLNTLFAGRYIFPYTLVTGGTLLTISVTSPRPNYTIMFTASGSIKFNTQVTATLLLCGTGGNGNPAPYTTGGGGGGGGEIKIYQNVVINPGNISITIQYNTSDTTVNSTIFGNYIAKNGYNAPLPTDWDNNRGANGGGGTSGGTQNSIGGSGGDKNTLNGRGGNGSGGGGGGGASGPYNGPKNSGGAGGGASGNGTPGTTGSGTETSGTGSVPSYSMYTSTISSLLNTYKVNGGNGGGNASQYNTYNFVNGTIGQDGVYGGGGGGSGALTNNGSWSKWGVRLCCNNVLIKCQIM